jgi:dimethylhistidine N-methyltransferase
MNPASGRQETAIGEDAFVRDVRAGLGHPTQKWLPPRYFYDDVGSALFEAITLLPEYGLARADERLIDRHAGEIVARLAPGVVVAELGSGSGTKTRRILTSLGQRGQVDYYPIDVSVGALERCHAELGGIGGVRVSPVPGTYLEGLGAVSESVPAGAQLLVLFLGSTIGNFGRSEGAAFLGELHAAMKPGDRLLVGTDLEKPVERLLAAYDDPAGVTAAFNRNVLSRMNRDLDANFDPRSFDHIARYDTFHRRIEIHLASRKRQEVTIPAAELTVPFECGETIWTESSYKFDREEVVREGAARGFRLEAQWIDAEWPFAETLFSA